MYTQTTAGAQARDEADGRPHTEAPPEEARDETQARAEPARSAPRWSPAKRAAFRFVCAYLVLYNIPFPLGEQTFTSTLVEKYENLWHPFVRWVGRHVLRLSHDITVFTNGSGDTTYDYVRALCYVALAACAALLWSALDRRRPNYARLYDWLRLYVRLVLGLTMVAYGAAKAIPVQMPAPHLTRLLQPYGDSSPMGLLWTFMGASPAFEVLTGCAEIVGGLLLFLPRTTLLGALLCLADTAFIFALNMCYDVPVKLYSFHLLLMSLFLVAPDAGRLASLFLLNRRVEPAEARPLFRRRRLERAALVFQAVFGLYLLGFNLYGAYQQSKVYGFNAPKPPLYGIWVVDEFASDGQPRPPLVTDAARWQRVVFQVQKSVTIQPMTGPNQSYTLELDEAAKTLTLGKRDDPQWKAVLTYREAGEGRLTVEGDFGGHATRAELTRFDESKFLLRSRGFNWIQERPFNR